MTDPAESGATGRPPGGAHARGHGQWTLIASGVAVLVGVSIMAVAATVLLPRQPASPVAGESAPGQAGAGNPDVPGVALPPPATASHEARAPGIGAAVDRTWADALAGDLGVPERALRAYAGAAVAVSEEYPECGIGWNTLAGIGYVESHHATIGGATLDADGRATPPIVGIALDGSRSGRIADTDDGVLDGDAVWDRAVGPMQFIPSTWARWGTDGNGDGRADPQQIDDAVYSAARYLCWVGKDLRKPRNWIAAVGAYNNSVEYNNRVADAANHYARRAATR